MADDFDYGPRLDAVAYQAALVELHQMGDAVGGAGAEEAAERLRSGELELAIDHRLGRAFPRPQRERLQRLHHRLYQRREALVERLEGEALTPAAFADAMEGLLADFAAELDRLIGPRERAALLGGDAAEPPRLGLDPAKLEE